MGAGYVAYCLVAVKWAFNERDDFRGGALLAVNLGYDADTTGVVYSQIAGAYCGEEGISIEWHGLLTKRETILDLTDRLYESAQSVDIELHK